MNTAASVPAHRRRRPAAARAQAQAPTPLPTPASPQACWSAHVQACGDASLRIDDGERSFEARRAASCLLVPAPGDQVACVRTGPQEVWVLAVLQRAAAAGAPAVLACDGPLEIAAPSLSLRSGRLDVTAEHAVLSVGVAELIGRQLRAVATTVKVVGSVLTSVLDRVTHFSRHYQRTTQGTDRVSAVHIECEAEQLLRMQAEHVLANGSKLVKARGAQIHFG